MTDYPDPIPINEIDTYVRLAKGGNIAARRSLILRNGRLVLSMTKSFMLAHRIPLEFLDDMTQEGLVAIPRAIDRYEFNTSCTFISYLQFWVANALRSYIRRNKHLVHVPANLYGDPNKVKVSIKKAMDYVSRIKVLSEPTVTDEEGKTRSLFDSIPDTEEIIRDYNFGKFKLNNRETEILNLVINENKSFVNVASSWGISREGVRQVYKNAMAKVMHKLKPTGIEYLGETLHFHYLTSEIKSSSYIECYVKTSHGIERRDVRFKSMGYKSSNYTWVDRERNTYKDVYDIPYSHFRMSRLKVVYNSIIHKLEAYRIKYKFTKTGPSDSWKIKFDSYQVRLTINNNTSALELSSYLGDINTTYYNIHETDKLYYEIFRILRRLR